MKIVAVLHDVRSVHNVGSIFRTADAAGITKIFLCGITPSPFDRLRNLRPDFAKVALGAEKYTPWESAKEITAILSHLKKEGYSIFAAEQSKGSVPYDTVPVPNKIALILGNEVAGLPPSVLELADHVIEIPMMGKKESLNVAVAFGVLAFGLQFRKR